MRPNERDIAVLAYLAPCAVTAARGLAAWAARDFALPYPTSAIEEVVGSGALFAVGVIATAAATAILLLTDAKGSAGDAAVWGPLLLASFNFTSYLLFAAVAARLGPVEAISLLLEARYPAMHFLSMLVISALAWLAVAKARGVELRRKFTEVAKGVAPLAGLPVGAALWMAGQSIAAFVAAVVVAVAAGLTVSREQKTRRASRP